MKHLIALFVIVVLGFLPKDSQAILCNNGKDLGCLASQILPFNQTGTSKREWAAVSGSVTGSGNTIAIKLRFDAESINTLYYTPSWYSAQGLLWKKFGLEIDISESNDGTSLRFDSIGSTFPSASRPTRDTGLSDLINKNKNAIGLLVRDAGEIQANTDYFVVITLKDPLPTNGVSVTLSLQISADTRLLGYALSPSSEPLFDWSILGSYLDKYDYFVVESESYIDGWKLYQDGREGLCWTSKTSSSVCSNPSPPPAGTQSIANSAANDPDDRMYGITTMPTVSDPSSSQADFIVDKFWIENSLGNKVKILYPGESFTTKGKVKNRGSANSPSAITVKYYRSNGRKVDSNKQEVGSDTIQAYNLPSGGTHTESVNLTAPTTPGTYNYTFCADTGNVVSEKHESNNCSDELIVEVVRRSPAEVKRFINMVMPIINDD